MNTEALLASYVAHNPTESVAQLAYADLLTETTGDYDAAVREAAAVAAATLARREKSRIRRLIRGTSLAALETALEAANGRRRERTLHLSDVLACIERVRKGRLTWRAIGGGNVANAYKYPASQTACVVVVRTDGAIRVAIGEVNASKGSSLTNALCGLTIRATAEQFRAWADAQD